jgi:Family of unknown function (DUF6200)
LTVATPGTSTGEGSQERTLRSPIVVVDIDQVQSSLQIKRLRKGQGKLMNHVEQIINNLIEAGTVKSTAQPVVIVVREYPSSLFGFASDDD